MAVKVYMIVMTVNVVVVAISFPLSMFSTNMNTGMIDKSNARIFWSIASALVLGVVLFSCVLYRYYIAKSMPLLRPF